MTLSLHDPDLACDQVRHDLNTKLTIIAVRTELLQRQLRRGNDFSAAQRRWLEDGLADILDATRVVITAQRLAQDCDC
jgi:hypothetical protein